MLAQGNINEFRKKIQNYSFCLTDKIGKGYSSVVYKGRNDITIAIKVIQLKSLKDQVSKNLLRTQLQCIKSIHHQNLLKYIDSYQTVNNCYIITEYCEGGDLQKQLKRKIKFSQLQTKNMFLQFYAGYKHFLQCGYIHRDLKPANIFLQNKVIKIADFGFVKRLGQNPKQSYNVGTPVYMPPQSLTSNIYTEKSDVWSIGVICYQLTHGKMPWRGANQIQLKSNIQLKSVLFQKNLISSQLQNFISSCLEKNPTNRLTIKQMWSHPWMQCIKSLSKPSSIPIITPSYLLPSVKIKNPKFSKKMENKSITQGQKSTKYSTLDHLVSILNYLRFIFKIFKFINENNIEYKQNLKKNLLFLLLKNLQNQQIMVNTGQNVYKLKQWDQFKKSSKWKVYKGVVDQYSQKYRKLDVDKQNIPAQKLVLYINQLLTKIKYLKSVQVGNKSMFRNIQALDYLVSLQSLRSLGQRQGWSALLQKSPINNIVQCRCHVDVENYIQVLAKLQKKINCIC